MGRVENKVAIVTGAGGGIGAATASTLASEGAIVVLADISLEAAEQAAASIKAEGGACMAVPVDIADEESVAALFATVAEEYGTLDILCNNAADTRTTVLHDHKPVMEADVDTWDATFRTNARGTFLMCRGAIPALLDQDGGAIINIASDAALRGELARTAYGASKGAIATLTLYVASQYGRQGIRCNAVAPGFIETPMNVASVPDEVRSIMLRVQPSQRLGRPDDIAWCVTYLASDEASFVNGQLISVDGGLVSQQPHVADVRDLMSAAGPAA